ncbi:50S ribosomal protein L16 3-hydroxylase [Thalassocella blandensis]|nr:50S ribosomal protein L16 3-hydroxylase [Thalassocella blandensis]
MPALKQLGSMPIDEFLRDYWQKKPVLIRQAFTDLQDIISADELAGLSLEEDVNSRLIIETPTQPASTTTSTTNSTPQSNWQVQHGPLADGTFSNLPESHWSLLVQHVDALDPNVNQFLQNFRFIPNWRLDDIMISYATDMGGVGPHFDYYDVFLIQAAGKRRWRLGQNCNSQSALVPDQPMKLLQEFTTSEDWIVEPGDLLYVPAQLAHWGEAIGESMTYSVGFRAPADADILLEYAQEKASSSPADIRYRDPDLQFSEASNAIGEDAITKVQAMLLAHCQDKTSIAKWLGEYSTELKQNIECMLAPLDENELELSPFQLSPYCRTAYYAIDSTPKNALALLFVNGQSWECDLRFARDISQYQAIEFQQLVEREQKIVLELHALEVLCRP